MPVLLIRHGHAGSRKDWSGKDRERPLSEKGRRQAANLVGELSGWGVQRILSSPYTRCVQTVEPLAKELGLKVEVTQGLSEDHGNEALALARSLSSEKVALCTHGDVIADVLVPIVDEDRVDLGSRPRQQKGSVWVLEADGSKFARATYVPPRD